MNSKPNAKKIIQVSEEAQSPVHVPIIIGNECFIITQQDVRRIEDMRVYSYSKLTKNGELIPVETLGYDGNTTEAIIAACRIQQQAQMQQQQACIQPAYFGQPVDVKMAEFINHLYCPQGPNAIKLQHDMATAAGCVNTTATLDQQLQWAKANENSSAPFPYTYTTGTSTSELPTYSLLNKKEANKCCCCSCSSCNSRSTKRVTFATCGNNTMDVDEESGTANISSRVISAREQLKQKKIAQDCSLNQGNNI